MKSLLKEIEFIVKLLEAKYGIPQKPGENLPLLDLLVLHVLKPKEKFENVMAAYKNLKREFVDWNEVRVSQPREIYEAMESHLKFNVHEKAHRLRDLLSKIFHFYNTMEMDFLWEKDFAEIQKFLQKIQDIDDEFLTEIIPYACYQIPPPLDNNFIRVGKRLGLWDESISPNIIKKNFYKEIGEDFFFKLHTLLFFHGRKVCISKGYDCLECVIAGKCKKKQEESTARKGRKKKTDVILDEEEDATSMDDSTSMETEEYPKERKPKKKFFGKENLPQKLEEEHALMATKKSETTKKQDLPQSQNEEKKEVKTSKPAKKSVKEEATSPAATSSKAASKAEPKAKAPAQKVEKAAAPKAKSKPAKKEEPKAEAPKVEAPKVEAPKVEAPKAKASSKAKATPKKVEVVPESSKAKKCASSPKADAKAKSCEEKPSMGCCCKKGKKK